MIIMASTVEEKKQQYSRQLAAYTLRQWNAVRQETAALKKEKQATSNRHEDRENDREEDGQRTPGRQKGSVRKDLQVKDFGSHRSPKTPS
ncbi:hypothetical protein D9613_001645 [Agrocybe pediades]|uniref:Uncharacterized protein n=1 Tax=Agrocybe pediades TaxID=84607 RepID=A0A8H4R7K2_9AGAR|nr:hypothetical protein D9613_001645 [Agrocybe pediades]KAF9568565.1 hypothetical protein CPC08DRAFT_813601 [Agrocybe pediades]